MRKFIGKLLLILCLTFTFVGLMGCFYYGGEAESAYDIAARNGFKGTEQEWLNSLKGENLTIQNIYAAAKAEGYEGDLLTFVRDYFKDTAITGESAYEAAVAAGFKGSKEEWLASLKGDTGDDGAPGETIDLYKTFLDLKNEGVIASDCTFSQFLKENFDINVNLSSEQVISNALRSAVTVYALTVPFESINKNTVGSTGAGVIFKMASSAGDAYIITNYHVVYNTEDEEIMPYLYVMLYGSEFLGKQIPVEFVGGTSTYDIAVLRVKNSEVLRNSDCKAVEVFDSNNLIVGTKAIAIGNPEGGGMSVTEGILSVDSETIAMSPISKNSTVNADGLVEMRVLRIDTPVNSGNSGGGLFDSNGRLIGIVNAKIKSSGVENIAYAIPSNIAVNVANNIIDQYEKTHTVSSLLKCLMGVTITITDTNGVFDSVANSMKIVEKVVVHEVDEAGVAHGVLKKDDILVSMELRGVTYNITRRFVVVDACLNAREGDVAKLNIVRNGAEMTVSIKFKNGVFIG